MRFPRLSLGRLVGKRTERWVVETLNRRERRWEQHEGTHRDLGRALSHAYRLVDGGNRWVRIYDADNQRVAYRTRTVRAPSDEPYPIQMGGRTVRVYRFGAPEPQRRMALVQA